MKREISSPHSRKQSDLQSVVYRVSTKRICCRPNVKGLWFNFCLLHGLIPAARFFIRLLDLMRRPEKLIYEH